MTKRQVFPDVSILSRVQTLCELGSRPPIIESIFPSIPRNSIAAMWEQIHGRRAPKGPLPTFQPSYLSSTARRLQASYILLTFEKLREAGVGDVDAAITTYKDYLATFPEVEEEKQISFDRAWALVRALNRRSEDGVILTRCRDCGAKYVHFIIELINDRNCPVRRCVENYEDIVDGVLLANGDTGYVEMPQRTASLFGDDDPSLPATVRAQPGDIHELWRSR